MAEFSKAFGKIIELEGGYVDHESDPGGATQYGISLRWLKSTGDYELGDIDGDGDIDKEDIKKMSIQDAAKLYKKHWWDQYGYGQLSDQHVANKLFDMSINMGSKQAHKLLQRSINTVLGQIVLVDDGVLGPKTSAGTIEALKRPVAFLAALRAHQEGFYRMLVVQKPKLKVFLKGWLNRAVS